MNVQLCALFLARAYGRFCPLPWRKWQVCLQILALARIHPWRNTANWQRVIKDLPPEVVNLRGIKIRSSWQEGPTFMISNDFEPYECNVAKSIIRRGDTVLDVGAHVGFMSLFFARCTGPAGRVYAYEPVEWTAQRLKANLDLNTSLAKGEIIVRKKGLGNVREPATIFLPKAISGTGINAGSSSIIAGFCSADREVLEEQIHLTRLDDEVIEEPIDFVKCDIEGAEKMFLEGGRSRLSIDQPVLMMEWNPGPNTYSAEEIAGLIRSIGDYQVFDIRHYGLSPTRLGEKTKSGGNVLCAIRKRHKERLARLLPSW